MPSTSTPQPVTVSMGEVQTCSAVDALRVRAKPVESAVLGVGRHEEQARLCRRSAWRRSRRAGSSAARSRAACRCRHRRRSRGRTSSSRSAAGRRTGTGSARNGMCGRSSSGSVVQIVSPVRLSRAAMRALVPPGVTITRGPSTSRHSLIGPGDVLAAESFEDVDRPEFPARSGVEARQTAVGVQMVQATLRVGTAGPRSRVGGLPGPPVLRLPLRSCR